MIVWIVYEAVTHRFEDTLEVTNVFRTEADAQNWIIEQLIKNADCDRSELDLDAMFEYCESLEWDPEKLGIGYKPWRVL